MSNSKILYGIMNRSDAEALGASLSPQRRRALAFECQGSLAAVIGEPLRPHRFQRRQRRLEDRQAQYARTLERLMEEGDVLPAPLNCTIQDLQSLNVLLRRHRARLEQMLARFQGQMEVGVSVTWEVGRYVGQALTARAPENSDPALGLQPRTAAGLQQEVLMEQLRLRQKLLDTLGPLIVDRLVEKPGAIDEVLSARFLVHKDKEQELYEMLTAPELTDIGLKARFYGPLPPRSFVNLSPLLSEDPTAALRPAAPSSPAPRSEDVASLAA